VNNDEYPGLGTWVSRQRTAYSNEQKLRQGLPVKGSARIGTYQIAKLETLGFQWDRTASAVRTRGFHAGLLQQQQPQQSQQQQQQQQRQQQQQPQHQVPVPASLTSPVGDGLVDAAAALLQLRKAGGGEQSQEQPQGQPQGQAQGQPQEQGVALEGSNLSAKAPDPDATETEYEETEDEEDSDHSRPEGDENVAKSQKRPRDVTTRAGTSIGTFASHCGSVRLAGGGSSDDSSDVKRTKRLPFPAQSSSDAPQRTKSTVNHDSKAAASKLGVCKQAKDKICDDAARAESFKRMYVNFWLKYASCPLHKLNVSMSCRIGTARRTR
jgi:hypothetical protein